MNGLLLLLVVISADGAREHLALGNPSGAQPIAKAKIDNAATYLLVKDEYCLSYDNTLGGPNWVAWHCSKKWLGKADRENDFRADEGLPENWYHVAKKDYDASGFDRGHVCPSGDRTKSAVHNSATFLMTNMMPQAPKLNRGTWKQLEDHCRKLVGEGSELYIVAGPAGAGGWGSKGYQTRLEKKITVPSSCWKVVLVLDDDESEDFSADCLRVTARTVCFGALFPNSQEVQSGWEHYATTVRELEQVTGYNFFSEVAEKIQDSIEQKMLED